MLQNFALLATAIFAASANAATTCTYTAIQNKPASLNCGVEGQVAHPQLLQTFTVPGGSFTSCRGVCRENSKCDYYSFYSPKSQCRTYSGTISGAGFTAGSTGTKYWNKACYTATCKTSTSGSSTSGTTTVDVSGESYQDGILKVHNLHRSNHSASALTWSTTMANYAKEIAQTCVYAHSRSAGDGNYGQNIGAGATSAQVAGLISNDMYNAEMPHYPRPYGTNKPDMSNFEAWGHFSQIVWAGTKQVGCYTQHCTNGLKNTGGNIAPYFTVCNYYPPGNYENEYSNVHAPQGQKNIYVVPYF